MFRSLVTVAVVACLLAPTQATGSSLSPNAGDETHRDGSHGAVALTLGELFKSSGSSETAATTDTERNLIATNTTLIYSSDGELRMFGCFADKEVPRDMDANTYMALPTGSRTLAKCAAYCKTLSKTFFAIQGGYACFCSNTFGSYGPATNCNAPCDDGLGNCGGAWSNYVGMLTPSNPGTNTKTMLCMQDKLDAGRDMAPTWSTLSPGGRTLQACASLCKPPGTKSTMFFAMQAGFACFCSDVFGSYGTASNCDRPCDDGNGSCGGALANSVGFVNGWTQGLYNNGCLRRPQSCPTGSVPIYDRAYTDPNRQLAACVVCPTDDAYDIAFPIGDGSGLFYCGRVNTCPDGMKKVASTSDSVQCTKFSYGRGSGYSSSAWGQCVSDSQSLGCEWCGGWAYPKCSSGYKNNDAGTCDSCSNCWLCYKNCPAGYTENQTMCFSKKSAPVGPLYPVPSTSVCANTPYTYECGVFCTKDLDACNAVKAVLWQQTNMSVVAVIGCALSAVGSTASTVCGGAIGVKEWC